MECIKDYDFLVLPSISKVEAFALVQIEAMASANLSSTQSFQAHAPYVSPDGKTGITVGRRIQMLREAMDTVSDASFVPSMAKSSRAMVEECYNNDEFVKGHREWCLKVCWKDEAKRLIGFLRVLKAYMPDSMVSFARRCLDKRLYSQMSKRQQTIEPYQSGKYEAGINLIGNIRSETGLGET